MHIEIERTKRVLEMPLEKGPRLLLILGVLLAAGSFVAPLWSVAVSTQGAPERAPTVYTFRLGAAAPSSTLEASGATGGARGRGGVSGSPSPWQPCRSCSFGPPCSGPFARSWTRSSSISSSRSAGSGFSPPSSRGSEVSSRRSGTPRPDLPSVLFGRWETGGLHFSASPGAGAWTLAGVALVLVSALYVAWRNARKELTTQYLIAG